MGDSGEFSGIGGHENQRERQSLARQEKIIRPDGLALRFKESANPRRFLSRMGVERYLRDGLQ